MDHPAPAPPAPSRPAAGYLRRRLLPPLSAALLLIVGVFSFALVALHEREADRHLEQAARGLPMMLDEVIKVQLGGLVAIIGAVARDPDTREALAAGDAERLAMLHRDLYDSLRRESGVTHFYFHDPARINLLRFHAPERRGDRIDRRTALEAERTGRVATGIELGPLGTFTLRAVCPVTSGEALLGYVEAGKEIGEILAAFPAPPGLHLAVTMDKRRLSRPEWENGMRLLGREAEWDRFPDEVLVSTTMPGLPLRGGDLPGERVNGIFRREGHAWHLRRIPFLHTTGEPTAHLLILSDLNPSESDLARTRGTALAVAVPTLLLLLLAVSRLLGGADAALAERERALRENEARYRALFHNAANGIATCEVVRDDAGRVVDLLVLEANPAASRLLGLPAEGIAGRRVTALLTAVDGMPLIAGLARAALEGRPATGDSRLETLERCLELAAFRVDEQRVALVFTDVTERLRAEEERRSRFEESERLNRLMFAREERVVELKAEVNRLEAELGRPPRYPSAEPEPAP